MSEKNSGRSEAAGALVRPSDDTPSQTVAAGRGTEMQLLIGPSDGAPNFALRRFRMGPGGGMPRHTNRVEHEQFVLRGRARVRLGDAVHEVTAGDVLLIPAGMPHDYSVIDAPFEFLCIVPNAEDRIDILDE